MDKTRFTLSHWEPDMTDKTVNQQNILSYLCAPDLLTLPNGRQIDPRTVVGIEVFKDVLIDGPKSAPAVRFDLINGGYALVGFADYDDAVNTAKAYGAMVNKTRNDSRQQVDALIEVLLSHTGV